MIFLSRAFRWVAPLAVLTLFGAGCFGGGSSTSTGLDGGVYHTRTAGVTWQQMRILNLGTKLGSIADVGAVALAVDPQDANALYTGTSENGLIYSLDNGESWMQAKGFSGGRINAVVVDPKNKCVVYAARGNQIHKTTNCLRDWNQVYFDGRSNVVFTTLAIDWFNPNTIYAGTSDGDVFRTSDGGATWQRVYRLDGTRITDTVMDPHDSRVLYAGTDGGGIVKTADAGATWTQIDKPLREFEGARRVKHLAIDPLRKDVVYAASKYGILRTIDGGVTWMPLTLPTPPGSVDIQALVIHPTDANTLVYATNASIVWSLDAGKTWSPKKLPTLRGVSSLLFDHAATSGLFLGVAPLAK